MVYNTTDNRSSLSITDLTSDGEYLVTVAGRDGAGRLGQESEELIIIMKRMQVYDNYLNNSILLCMLVFFAAPEIVLLGYAVLNDCVILQWKV